MKNGSYILIVCLISASLISGCVTRAAEPATIDQETLDELGWAMLGDVQKESLEYEISGTNVAINTAVVNYYDKALGEDVVDQVDELITSFGGTPAEQDEAEEGTFSSQFITVRLALPGEVVISEQTLIRVIDTQVHKLAKEYNIQNFHSVGETPVTISTGEKIKAKSYEGFIQSPSNNSITITVRGVIASWNSNGTTTIVLGVIPAEDLTISVPKKLKKSGSIFIEIDEEKEFEEILTLIEHVE